MAAPPARDFYELQKRQWRLSLVLASFLFIVYFLFISLFVLLGLSFVELLAGRAWPPPGSRVLSGLAVAAVIALAVAVAQYWDARKNGAKFILKRLGAQPPDPLDRYHQQFLNTVDEIRIAAGLPRAKAYVLPFLAVNSMALMEADRTPAVVVTEGLLSEDTRDELQAAVAHELAHIRRGDTFFITLVCSLADLFERIRASMIPEEAPGAGQAHLSKYDVEYVGSSALAFLVGTFSASVMRLLSILISRQREILADAAAVELCRSPVALARLLYKASLKNTFVGDFSLTYSPLFIISSDPLSEKENLWSDLFSTHPPLKKRLGLLAGMAHKSIEAIVEEVLELRRNRRQAQTRLVSLEEMRSGQSSTPSGLEQDSGRDKVWLLQDDAGQWMGPLSLAQLLDAPHFSLVRRIRNTQEGVEAQAREFPWLRQTLQRSRSRRPGEPSGSGTCPHCRAALREHFYEGLAILICPSCQGKLVDAGGIQRILARKEVTFSEDLLRKAQSYREKFLTNPLVRIQKAKERETRPFACPVCGYGMVTRPYNYQYFIPVEKCLSCYRIWFDADELEVLQILVEKL